MPAKKSRPEQDRFWIAKIFVIDKVDRDFISFWWDAIWVEIKLQKVKKKIEKIYIYTVNIAFKNFWKGSKTCDSYFAQFYFIDIKLLRGIVKYTSANESYSNEPNGVFF